MERAVNALVSFLETNLNTWVSASAAILPAVVMPTFASKNLINGYVDIDAHTDPLVVSVIPDGDDYEELTIETTQATTRLSVYAVIRKADRALLAKQILRLVTAFGNMIKASPTLGGLVGSIVIEHVDVYAGVEGKEDVKAAQFAIRIDCEE